MVYKVRKTKKGIKINNEYVGTTFYEERIEKTDRKNIYQSRPDRLRIYEVKVVDSDVDVNVEMLKNIIPELKNHSLTQKDFNDFLERTSAEFYNQSNNGKWGNKAIAGILNDFFETNIFTY